MRTTRNVSHSGKGPSLYVYIQTLSFATFRRVLVGELIRTYYCYYYCIMCGVSDGEQHELEAKS